MEETEVILLWGSNARETHPIFFHHVLKALHAGARLYVIDPRRTSSARWAHVHLAADVGSDIALANAMGREILEAGLADEGFIRRATSGIEAYRESVEKYTLKEGERLTGVPADVIRLVLRDGTSEVRRVVAYEELSDQEEMLTLQTAWTIGGTVDEVLRVEYVEKVRFDSDEITLTHIDALGNSNIDVPVKATLA